MWWGFFDPMYLVFVAPAILLSLWAQLKVHSSFAAGKEVPSPHGATGAEAAHIILRNAGLDNVAVERSEGFLSDHYDPTAKVLRLSPDVYDGQNMAAIGVAAHEAGHALQDAHNYAPLVLRNGIVPLANVGSMLSWILLTIGFVLHSMNLILVGIALFSLIVIFQLINLPVEFDASARAKALLGKLGLTKSEEETAAVRRVLSAAAMTYVAATMMSVMQLLYYLFRAGLLGGRSDDDA